MMTDYRTQLQELADTLNDKQVEYLYHLAKILFDKEETINANK